MIASLKQLLDAGSWSYTASTGMTIGRQRFK